MITAEEILELAEQILEVDGIRDDGSFSGFYGTTKNIILFARCINDRGYNIGYDNGMVDYRELKEMEQLK
jgi:3-deoxy-D-manno-octulosonic acid (KDO) 8-phosphate synthase